MRKWKCTACGYIHTGDEPPETCPVCSADRSKFIELSETEAPPEKTETAGSAPDADSADVSPILTRVAEMISRHHLHPISVHIPNGVLPVAVVFLLMSVIFGFDELGKAAFYNLLFVVLAMPVVLISGFVDWKRRYAGKLNRIFVTKMICGALVMGLSLFLVIWRILDPDVAGSASATRWSFVAVHLIALVPAVIAGFYGGKLVFKEVNV
jgi:uncharacterized membrane protein/rubredoxin